MPLLPSLSLYITLSLYLSTCPFVFSIYSFSSSALTSFFKIYIKKYIIIYLMQKIIIYHFIHVLSYLLSLLLLLLLDGMKTWFSISRMHKFTHAIGSIICITSIPPCRVFFLFFDGSLVSSS